MDAGPGAVAPPLGRLLPRRLEARVWEALADTRVVLVNGARQCGKSTLARLVADATGAQWRSLDNEATRRAALRDPVGFVEEPSPLVIDEVQRAPDLLLAIKERVDRDTRPGQFVLTGSARVLGLHSVADALPGRMETVELFPFSQGEIGQTPDEFVDAAFDLGERLQHESLLGRRDYAERLVRGGFPEAVARQQETRRRRFLDAYVDDLVVREVQQISEIERLSQLRALTRLVAARSGQLVISTSLGNDLRLSHTTVIRYLDLLELVFLIKRIPAWSRNLSSRATSTPKIAMVDSAVAANLLGLSADALLRPDGAFGPLLEGFVLMELARQLTWSRQRAELFHYRTRDQVEVDAVLENRQGQVVAVEAKAASTVRAEDFRGLQHLRERLGRDFVVGLVLYTGRQTLPFGDRLRAIPISTLWETHSPAG